MDQSNQLFDAIQWNAQGLVPAIAQDTTNGDVLMLAWMNQEALMETIRKGQAVYWSRSRQSLWHKGETSGHFQDIVGIKLDCDGDTLLLSVNQHGSACHTGARTCFFRQLDSSEYQWMKESS